MLGSQELAPGTQRVVGDTQIEVTSCGSKPVPISCPHEALPPPFVIFGAVVPDKCVPAASTVDRDGGMLCDVGELSRFDPAIMMPAITMVTTTSHVRRFLSTPPSIRSHQINVHQGPGFAANSCCRGHTERGDRSGRQLSEKNRSESSRSPQRNQPTPSARRKRAP